MYIHIYIYIYLYIIDQRRNLKHQNLPAPQPSASSRSVLQFRCLRAATAPLSAVSSNGILELNISAWLLPHVVENEHVKIIYM